MGVGETAGVFACLLIIILSAAGVIVYTHYFLFGRTAMVLDIRQAQEYLWRARASDNLEEIANYMNHALEALHNREGNPNWLWHLPDTDFNLIKHDLEKNIAMALNVSNHESPGSYGYQRCVDNMQEICIELNEHLDEAIRWSTDLNLFNIILNVICWAIYLICWIIFLISG